jgi:hypothetical protein
VAEWLRDTDNKSNYPFTHAATYFVYATTDDVYRNVASGSGVRPVMWLDCRGLLLAPSLDVVFDEDVAKTYVEWDLVRRYGLITYDYDLFSMTMNVRAVSGKAYDGKPIYLIRYAAIWDGIALVFADGKVVHYNDDDFLSYQEYFDYDLARWDSGEG